jgi:hypothetical protein
MQEGFVAEKVRNYNRETQSDSTEEDQARSKHWAISFSLLLHSPLVSSTK